jgi:apolipoprotein N-acyltransferase
MKQKILLSILSGVLLSLAWTTWGLGWLMLLAFIPLFFVEDYFFQNKTENKSRYVFNYAYITFLTWNIISTWWVTNSTLFGGIAAVVLNSLFYALIFWIFHITKRRMGIHTGYSALIIFWLAFERLYINGEISWVWLILGNGFANNVSLVQWYEFTGTLGGSLWVLLINIFAFNFIQHIIKYKTIYGQYIFLSIFLLTLIAPIVVSKSIYNHYKESKDEISVSIVQPNIDPYNEKFNGLSQAQQLEKMLNLIEQKGNPDADLFILPETAVDDGIFENDYYQAYSTQRILSFIKKYPTTSIIYGATTRYLYVEGGKGPYSRVYRADTSLYYDIFNTALQINKDDEIKNYHKSKLVIGVEMTPYPFIFNYFNQFAIDLGGTTGNLGRQEERSVFSNSHNKAVVAPVICYESIYGEFVTEYIHKGANLIAIITNDGWWGDTPGYKQHLSFAKLRAIETRRSIVRSANTGVSAIINQKGDIEQATEYWVEDVINGTVNLNNKATYFVKNGDFIGRTAQFFSLLLLLSLLVSWIKSRKEQTQA